jgi:hypothetical protein
MSSRRRFIAAKRLALAPILAATLTLHGCDGISALAGIFTQLASGIAPVQQVIGLVSRLPGNPLSSGVGQKVMGVLNTVSQVGSKVQQAQALTNTARSLDPTRLSPIDTIQRTQSLVSGASTLFGSD